MFTTTYKHSKPIQETQILRGHPNAKELTMRWIFNEGSGVFVRDVSGHECNVTLTNIVNADWTHQKHGSAVRFTPANLTYGVPARESDYHHKVFTVSAWISMITLPTAGNQVIILDATNFGGPYEFYLHVATVAAHGNVPRFRLTVWVGGTPYSAVSPQITTNTFYHVVGVKTYSHVELYLDGILEQSTVGTGLGNAQSFTCHIARRRDTTGGGWYLDGIISDLSINDYPFNAQEVLQLYEEPYGIFVKSPMISVP